MANIQFIHLFSCFVCLKINITLTKVAFIWSEKNKQTWNILQLFDGKDELSLDLSLI